MEKISIYYILEKLMGFYKIVRASYYYNHIAFFLYYLLGNLLS